MKKYNLFAFLCFLFIIMIISFIYLFFVGIKKNISKNDLFVITKTLNSDEYIPFFQEEYTDIRDIDLSVVLDSNVFYDKKDIDLSIFDSDEIPENINLDDYYLKASIDSNKFNKYVKKYTGYNISEFKYEIKDEMDKTMNFLHTKVNYNFKALDCVNGYKKKDKIFLSCYISGNKNEYTISLKNKGDNYKIISNKCTK